MVNACTGVEAIAPAKINLFLHVGDKRADGFHDLESLVAFARTGDTLHFIEGEDLHLTISGPFGANLTADEDNLVIRAARALAKAGGVDAKAAISLTKNLPVASGIGGGSADAAATLRGLNTLWNLNLPVEQLQVIGAELGSDVPVCVAPRPSWMAGRGEKVTALPGLPSIAMVLCNPGVPVPTGPVFKALETRRGTGLPLPGKFEDAKALVKYLNRTSNDLEAPALKIAPVVGQVLAALRNQPGCLLGRMSGSGATCFALFTSAADAVKAASAIRAAHPEWWAVAA